MLLVPSVNTLYSCISLKMFMVITVKFISENIIHMEEIRSLLNRCLHEFLVLTVIILRVFICEVNIFLLLEEIPHKNILYFITE
jgi:hypothetical protein